MGLKRDEWWAIEDKRGKLEINTGRPLLEKSKAYIYLNYFLDDTDKVVKVKIVKVEA